MTKITGIDHVQVAMPVGAEEQARAFYAGVLGLPEIPKPVHLALRGGVWFQCGAAELHLGADAAFQAAKKAHPALAVDDMVALLARNGGGWPRARDAVRPVRQSGRTDRAALVVSQAT
jgi:catechol 2,3-dioxygenase-like lactoylglutathione lyase family enzyme